jgi:hypothetical protein
MDFKVGELYYSTRLGVFVVKELYLLPKTDNKEIIGRVTNYEQIGTCQRLSFGEREYKLFPDDRIREAADSDIVEFLVNQISKFEVGDKNIVTIDEEFGVTVFGEYEAVNLDREAARKLRDLLNREIA